MARFKDRFISTASHPTRARGGAGPGFWMFLAARFFTAQFFAALFLAACSANPTPYQPLGEEGGYEETRLQQSVYRVSFKGNRNTRETDVLDFLFLRSAELTVKNGFTHFVIQENFGRTQIDLQAEAYGSGFQFGFGYSNRGSFWALEYSIPPPPYYTGAISYHLAMFVIKMLKAEEAASYGYKAFHAKFMIESLSAKKEKSLRKSS